MKNGWAVATAALLISLIPRPAAADITAFLGANTTPANRLTKGFAFGAGLLFIGFEFEYADTSDDVASGSPELKTYMGNVLLQTPMAVFGFQPYFTIGGGVYDESLVAHSSTSFGSNTGGGVKISLIGPLRVRVDYRIMSLTGSSLYSPVHRFYVGANLKF